MDGKVSAYLLYFVDKDIAFSKPTKQLIELQKWLCGLHLAEFFPIETDIIYTKSVPLKRLTDKIKIFKADVNIFSSAHGTRNHDRKIPGGFLISVNAPGHYMDAQVDKGNFASFNDGLDQIKKLTL